MFRAVAWSASARWVTQILSWASTIIVARLLTPADYGLVGMAGVYMALATLVGQVGISDAVLTLRDLTSRTLEELNSLAVMVGATLVAISCLLAAPLARFFATSQLKAVVIVVSVSYLINGFQVVPGALLQRDLRFKLLAGIETLRAISQIVITVVMAWNKFGYWSLILGTILGNAIATVLTLSYQRYRFSMPRFGRLRREIHFSGNVLMSGIGFYVYSNSDFLVAGKTLGQAPLGDYSLAWTVSSAPIEKIGNLITNVTPAFFSAIQDNKPELRRYLLRLTELLSLITVPASIGIALLADYLVEVVFGPKWLGVIGPLRLLGIFFAVRSVTTILPKILTAVRESSFLMWNTFASALIMPLAFVIGSHWGKNGIAAVWIILYPVIVAPLYYRTFQSIELSAKEYLKSILPAMTSSVAMAAAVLLVRWSLPQGLSATVRLATLSALGALVYGMALLLGFRSRVTRVFEVLKSMRNR
jgi:O-antigen/teichoic acid export membrane protein